LEFFIERLILHPEKIRSMEHVRFQKNYLIFSYEH
jgi:hypothetical protein